ncbi:MAG: hypothetical protein LQ352_003852 [Teloschistes flavicans]|nr:MAG: hypothetical protein LQ352_003852 [Teloschistes flavicans]
MSYFDVHTFSRNVSPGDWYYFREGLYGAAIRIHLFTTIPAGLMMLLQFVPKLRARALDLHRINGYTVIALMSIGNVTALLVMRRSFGGDIAVQSAVVTLAVASQIAMYQAWRNAKMHRIGQHRMWAMRAMIWMACIVSTRVVMPIAVMSLSAMDNYFFVKSCHELDFIQRQGKTIFSDGSMRPVAELYPECGSDTSTEEKWVAVKGKFDLSRPDQVGAALNLTFGMGLWLCFCLHAAALEVYFDRRSMSRSAKSAKNSLTVQGSEFTPENNKKAA